MDEGGTVVASGPSLRWRVSALPAQIRGWLAQTLLKAAVRLAGEKNSVQHARIELRQALAEPKTSLDRWMAEDLLQLLTVFSMQGHSGFSASHCISTFELLANHKPLGPLTGAEDEWVDHGHCLQNRRCSHVFKQPDRFGGQPYDIYGRVFREPSGSCYTSGDSHVPITFPYTPTREYVDVPAHES